MPSEVLPPVDHLVPQRGPSLLLSRVLKFEGDSLSAIGRIPTANAFAAKGAAPCFVGIEVAAQAAAALESLLRRRDSSGVAPQIGYLVGVRDARFDIQALPVEEDLIAHVHRTARAGALAIHEVHLLLGSTSCLSAVLTTFGRS
jgi:predicted hotdog family 3-hydroxylacyl-ACP dehydratase